MLIEDDSKIFGSSSIGFLPPQTVRKVLIDRNHAGSGKARSAQVLRKRNSSGKASSDAGPELAGRAAERRWKARRP